MSTAWMSVGTHGAPVAPVVVVRPVFGSRPVIDPLALPGVHRTWPRTAAVVRPRLSTTAPEAAPRGKPTICTPGVPPSRST
ncbi:hypothetical protein [Streptomyces sp. NPDC048710]|uniref:hypothetical protein n=1 Tax=unclassified Streptomyces TaxID=2593676 RepID=UPI0037227EE0